MKERRVDILSFMMDHGFFRDPDRKKLIAPFKAELDAFEKREKKAKQILKKIMLMKVHNKH